MLVALAAVYKMSSSAVIIDLIETRYEEVFQDTDPSTLEYLR